VILAQIESTQIESYGGLEIMEELYREEESEDVMELL
jgi:hypothetical protein